MIHIYHICIYGRLNIIGYNKLRNLKKKRNFKKQRFDLKKKERKKNSRLQRRPGKGAATQSSAQRP